MMTNNLFIVGASVTGNTHHAKGVPNQDSLDYWQSDDGLYWIAAIADGHGSASHPLSEYGSSFGTKIAISEYQNCCLQKFSPSSIEGISTGAQYKIFFDQIINLWRIECLANFKTLTIPDKERYCDDLSILRLYGSTLCIALRCVDSIIIYNIGDSSAYIRNDSGVYSDAIFLDNSPGEQTASLCQKKPLDSLEVKVIPVVSGFTLSLSTDGIIKSLSADMDYIKIVDYYHHLIRKGSNHESVLADLQEQLEVFSMNGSGDDCTMVILSSLSNIPATLASEKVSFEIKKSRPTKKKLLWILALAVFLGLLVYSFFHIIKHSGLRIEFHNGDGIKQLQVHGFM